MVNLSRSIDFEDFGFLYNGNKVSGIQKGGAADKQGKMLIGDRILQINGKEVDDNTSTMTMIINHNQ